MNNMMNNIGYNAGYNQVSGDIQFQHQPSGPQNQMLTYQNSGYKNKRGKKKSLILDIRDGDNLLETRTDEHNSSSSEPLDRQTHLTSATEFNIRLREPLIIDKHSEIYLDNLITYNCNLSDVEANSAFCLKINEFNIGTNVASTDNRDGDAIFNSIVLPNENNDVNNYFGAVVHKGRKYNWVADINPCTLTHISGTITNASGTPAFHGTIPNHNTYRYALVGIESMDDTSGNSGSPITTPILKDSTITAITPTIPAGPPSLATGIVLVDTPAQSDTLIFSTDQPLTTGDFNGKTEIRITSALSGVTTTYYLTSTGGFILRESGGPRMIAEFIIESFD